MDLGNFEKSQPEEGEHDGKDPEADDDLRFMPSEQLEMVVDRSHFKDAFLA